ncbi:MAG: LacI family DNA-binding transcriptional regulator [Ancrocorticia sp.]|uniref:LacI family DNA-binding transcriptional regulator n=1 Tax=Ancrocorticia sp. TaxID=2593684 RepID=UPI003F8F1360
MGTRPTQLDVARLAGVSRQTVSLVVRKDPRVSDEKRGRVLAAMESLDYRVNVAASALASRRTSFVGIVLSEFTNPFHADLVEAMRRRCEEEGLVPFIAPVAVDAQEESTAISRFVEMNVGGLVLISPLLSEGEISKIGAEIPTVVVTRNHAPDGVDVVHSNDTAATRLATEHLIDSGYTRIVFLGYDRQVPGDSAVCRSEGYRAMMKERGLPAITEFTSWDASPEAAREIVAQYSTGTGVVCHNDSIAIDVLAAVIESGLEPGDDVGVVGFDNTRISGFPGISLTTIDQRWEDIANRTIELIIDRIANGRTKSVDLSLPSTLVVRGSSTRRNLADT